MNNPVYILRLIAYIGQDSVCQLSKKLLSHEQCFLVVEFALKWKYSLKKGPVFTQIINVILGTAVIL